MVCEPRLWAICDLLDSCVSPLTTIIQIVLDPHRNYGTPQGPILWENLIRWPGPAVAEVWYNIRLTICTRLRACWIWAGSKVQGHASLSPDRKKMFNWFLCLIFSFHYFIIWFHIILHPSTTRTFFLPLISPIWLFQLRSIPTTLLLHQGTKTSWIPMCQQALWHLEGLF